MRALTLAVVAVFLLGPAPPADGLDATVSDAVASIFANRPDDTFVATVLKDDVEYRYMGFYLATYLDVKELRVYVVPFRGADVEAVDSALAAGDHATAFAALLENMRLEMGARYVSDVGLDGIHDADVPLGNGSIRDRFHSEQFADHAEADAVYRDWLRRALELVAS